MADNEKLKEFVKDLNAVGNIRNLEKTMNEIRSLNIPESPDEALQRDIRQQQYDTAVLRYKILQEDYEKSKQPQKEKVLTEDDAEYWKRLYELENWRTKYLELTEPKEETINYGGFTFGYNRDNGEYYIKDEDEYNKALDKIYAQKSLGKITEKDESGKEITRDVLQYKHPEVERIEAKEYVMDREIAKFQLELRDIEAATIYSGNNGMALTDEQWAMADKRAGYLVSKGIEYATVLVENGFDDLAEDWEERMSLFQTAEEGGFFKKRKSLRTIRKEGYESDKTFDEYKMDKLAELASSTYGNKYEIDQFIDFYSKGFGGGVFTVEDAAAIVRWDKNILIKDRPEFKGIGE